MRAPELVYGYATGQTRVLAADFIDAARISRLVDCADLSEMRLVMSETAYGRLLAATDTVEKIEKALDTRIADVYTLTTGPGIPAQLGDYFKSKHDFDNLRALLKSGFGRELDIAFSDLGWVPSGKPQDYAKTRSFAGFPGPLKTAAYAAVEAYERAGELGAIDVELDRHYYQTIVELASQLKSRWITGYTQLLIDIANARVRTRARAKELSDAATGRFQFPGGSAEESRDMRELLAKRPALDEYDKLSDGLARSYLRSARLLPSGPEAVFAFIASIELEVKLVRTVMIGRLSGFDPVKLKKRAMESN